MEVFLVWSFLQEFHKRIYGVLGNVLPAHSCVFTYVLTYLYKYTVHMLMPVYRICGLYRMTRPIVPPLVLVEMEGKSKKMDENASPTQGLSLF